MAILKCKMCGGNLEYAPDATVCECEYCGSKQTIPVVDDEKKISLYERANRLRFNCEFDKAAVIYESIVADFPEEAEAYWGLILCKYGIEYVDDPVDGKKFRHVIDHRLTVLWMMMILNLSWRIRIYCLDECIEKKQKR